MARKLRIELVLDASGVVTGVRTADGALGKLDTQVDVTNKRLSTFKKVLGGVALTVAARQLAVVTKELFNLASGAEETASKFRTTFEGGAEQVDEFGRRFANMAGLTQKEFRDLAAISGSILRGMGAEMADVVVDTERIVRLAADLSSFHNVTIDEAFTALRAGLVGESEPLRRFGILIDEAATKTRALAETGKTNEKQLTQLEKAQARLNLIYERAGVVVGDLERTQDSAANTARRLEARVREQAEAFATALMPAMTGALRTVDILFKQNKESIDSWTQSVAGAINNAATLTFEIILLTAQLTKNHEAAREASGAYNFLIKVLDAQTSLFRLDQQFRALAAALGLFTREAREAERQGRLLNMFLSAHAPLTEKATETTGRLTDATAISTKKTKESATAFEQAQESVRDLRRDLESLQGAGLPALVALREEAMRLERSMSQIENLVAAIADPQKVSGAPGVDTFGVADRLREAQMQAGVEIRTFTDEQIEEFRRLEAALEESAGNISVIMAALAESNAEVLADTFGNFAHALELAGAKSLAVYKGFAIAEAVAATWVAANKALASAPPPFNYALMASVIAVGLANVAKIASASRGNTGGAASGTRGPQADTTGSTAAALGGIRVQDRGFTTGALGAAASARAPGPVDLRIQVIEPDLFKLNTELTNASNVRAQVGSR